MDITTGFLIYVTLFRLTIIAVGLIAILLGYLLFVKDPVGQGKTTAILEKAGFKIMLKNFWPGAYFAAFGTVIIGLMLWQGSPELVIEELKTADEAAGRAQDTTIYARTEIRGDCVDTESCWNLLSDSTQSLSQAVQPISKIAEFWHREGRIGEALAMARLAARIEPENPSHLVLLAWLFLANKEDQRALQTMEAAVRRNSVYEKELVDLRARLQQ